ncbi:EF-hand domain-containing protein [Oceaniglobus ichthyenteri]|uniref:EF-hand domain-containing protein n=1 Tax=Oceaniglobus ichthyenteri TaxID=2136177 RepID=UPI000D3AB393|nr:EF-hand domain-containing protein [Oceaniglobus ichthyenteri]
MKRLMIAATVTAISTTAAFAAMEIADLDTDGDRFVSKEELMVALPNFDATFFDEIDTNGDNRISSEEFYTTEAQDIMARASSAEMQLKADTDGDGFVSYEELNAMVPMFAQSDFDEIDTNSDNRLSADELNAPGAWSLIQGEAAAATTMDIASMDTNNDNFVTYDELAVAFPKVPEATFNDIDTNDDGRLSANELNAPDARTMLNEY